MGHRRSRDPDRPCGHAPSRGHREGRDIRLDVLLVNYHSGHALPDAARAALAFAGAAPSFVLVDNSPGDGAVESFLEIVPDAHVISNARNVGFAAAVNQGIGAGEAEVVLLLNPDVSAIRGEWAAVAERLRTDERLGAVAPRLEDGDGTLQRGCRLAPTWFDLLSENLDLSQRLPRWRRPRRFQMLDWDYADARYVVAATGACLFLRRAALEDVGPFDERFFFYWEETDWLVRAGRRGWLALYLPDVQAVHKTSTSSGLQYDDMGLLLLEGQYAYARKHFGLATTVALRLALGACEVARYGSLLAGGSPGRRRRREHVRRRISIHLGGRTPGRAAAHRRAELADTA